MNVKLEMLKTFIRILAVSLFFAAVLIWWVQSASNADYKEELKLCDAFNVEFKDCWRLRRVYDKWADQSDVSVVCKAADLDDSSCKMLRMQVMFDKTRRVSDKMWSHTNMMTFFGTVIYATVFLCICVYYVMLAQNHRYAEEDRLQNEWLEAQADKDATDDAAVKRTGV